MAKKENIVMKRKALVTAKHSEAGFTLIELLIVIAIIALLMAILIPALNKAKEHGKRAACLNNLRQLTLAWMMYAQANDDKVVNGAAGGNASCQSCCDSTILAAASAPTTGEHRNELPWVGAGWDLTNWRSPIPTSETQEVCAMQSGARWKYLKERNVYHCPTANKGELITYETIDAMNGLTTYRGDDAKTASLSAKNLGQIKNAATRILYIDTGKLSPDSFAVYIKQASWFDLPMTRHGQGTCVSFADGHSARWMWRSKRTKEIGDAGVQPFALANNEPDAAFQDLFKVQYACWGKLNYTVPGHPVKLDDQ